jgi:type IV secretory pathway component VirB8
VSQNIPPEEYLEVAELVRTGEYFRESHNIYDNLIHDPMAERYLYVFITGLSFLILAIALIAMQGLYPLKHSVPFIVGSDSLSEDIPGIRSLLDVKGQDPDEALINYLVYNYVRSWEEYDIDKLDLYLNGIETQSTEEVVEEYKALIDPRNPKSPITLYQRHSEKSIKILNSKLYQSNEDYTMDVLFESTVRGKSRVKRARWQAKVTFVYSGIEIDQDTGKIDPISFVVTEYSNKLLQDLQE